jgi:hypothetical protein
MSLQFATDDPVKWLRTNSFVIKEKKTEETVTYFGRQFNKKNDIPHTGISNRVIGRVDSFKFIGVYIASDLSWDFHVDYIVKKVVKRSFYIRTLVHNGIRLQDVIQVYCSVNRSVL